MSRCLKFFLPRSKDFPDEDEAPIDILPDELLIEVFQMLPIEELAKCEFVCRRWRKVAADPILWRRRIIACSGQLGALPENTVALITSHSNCIRCIKLQYILNYSVIKSIIDQCIHLTSIELVMCRVEVEFEDDLKKWPNVKKLNLKNSLLKSDRDLNIQYDEYKDLNFLGLSGFGLSNSTCETLLNCVNLNHIHIEKIKGLPLEFIKRMIRTKQNTLASLRIHGGDSIDDDTLFILAKCPKLEELAVLRCELLSDKALAAIATYPNINVLQLWYNTTFSETALEKTLMSPVLIKLKSLSFSKVTNVSSRIVDIIYEYYKNLEFLSLYQCPKISRNDYATEIKAKFQYIQSFSN